MVLRVFLFLVLIFYFLPAASLAQSNQSDKSHKRFVMIYYDWGYTSPILFKIHPLQDLAGLGLKEVDDPYDPEFYRSRDGLVGVTEVEFNSNNRGMGIVGFPFGTRNGMTLAVKAGFENLPNMRFNIRFPDRVEYYRLNNGRAYDLGVGFFESNLKGGWGLNADSYLLVGKGWLWEPRGGGRRYFIEAGANLRFNIIGFGIFVKLNKNQLSLPRPHKFYTMPVGIRASLTF